jgi:hypothetical protein
LVAPGFPFLVVSVALAVADVAIAADDVPNGTRSGRSDRRAPHAGDVVLDGDGRVGLAADEAHRIAGGDSRPARAQAMAMRATEPTWCVSMR